MKKPLLAILMIACCTPALFGQAFSSLAGTVTDPTGAVIPGVTITIVNTQTGLQRETTSNAEGRYSFPQVLPGTYQLTAKSPGFTDVVIKDIQLLVNSPVTINVVFEKLGGVTETVQVEATAIQINTTDATLGNAIGTQTILELPFYARNVVNLLMLQPGVTQDGQVAGGKSDQANVTLDGVDVNDQVNRSAFTSVLRVTLDSVQEFRTTTTNANADQGRGSGAEVSMVTKSGTNEFHGSLYEYNRNDKFAANSFFSNRSGIERPALKINVFGGSIGGPIIKNKAFFFVNYEGRRDASASVQTRTVPTDNMRQGVVAYHDKTGALRTIGPDEIKVYADPAGIGVNPAVLKVFNQYPRGNMPGTGDGMNTISFRFNAPRHDKQDTYIARFDYTVDSAAKHQLFLRGNLQNDHAGGVPQFPGQPPRSETLANNKGIAAGYTWIVRPNMVSTTRYGLTRQGGETTGLQNAPYTSFRAFDTIYATTTATKRFVPVHSFSEEFAWTRGTHEFRFGGVIRVISNKSMNNNTFHSATNNASGLAGSGAELYQNIPGGLITGDVVTYTYAMSALLGLISNASANYQYKVEPDKSISVIPQGGYVHRNFANNEYEFYGQDSWRLRRNLTVTYGLRLSIMPPVREVDHQQVSTTVPLAHWLGLRGQLAAAGRPQYEAGDLTFVLADSPEGRPIYPQHNNLAPRLGIAYSPSGGSGFLKALFGGPGKTSIRAGFGMYYDLIGQPLVATFANTMFGLSNRLSSPLNTLDAFTAPRFTGFWEIPTQLLPAAPPAKFPVTYPYVFAITNSVDDQLDAPYTMNMNLSWGREFGKGWFVQASYVGRLSRHSLVRRDLAMPTNLKDPVSGMTYFQAMQILGAFTDIQEAANRSTSYQRIPPIPFFENLWPAAAGGGYTATQNIANYYVRGSNQGDFTNVLHAMDDQQMCKGRTGPVFRSNGSVQYLPCSKFGPNAMFSPQYGALSGQSSIGMGNYHSAQLTIRKQFTQSLLLDFNYTLSKSIDIASGTEDAGSWGGGFITNSWDPYQRRSVSDYDALHQVNAHWVWKVPVGRGMRFGSNMNSILEAILGGWQISGIYRQSSALPTNPSSGSVWATNWQLSDPAMPTGSPEPPIKVNKNGTLPNGTSYPSMFATKEDALKSIAAYRQTFPGQMGPRNNMRITGPFNIDAMLAKTFRLPYKEGHQLQIRWESFNLTNTAILTGASLSKTATTTWGRLNSQRGDPRQMQFAIRYVF